MLSTQTISSVSTAKHYFMGQDNYYTKDSPEAKESSLWFGKGSEILGLSGKVDEQQFEELLSGRLPDGQQLGIKVDGELKHRAGFDLTFSVPKSVSIAALMGGDKRIQDAMIHSVKSVLSMIEMECAQARKTINGETFYENTENLVGAMFLHDLSREADPQLHIHSVIMNMTKRHDGHWRSLASQDGKYNSHIRKKVNGFIEQVRHRRNYYGLLFRSELAYELKNFGYELTSKKEGFFELKGISDETLKAFSSRRNQIESYMKEHNFSSSKAAALATVVTRQSKRNINRDTLNERWRGLEARYNVKAFEEARQTVEHSVKHKEREHSSELEKDFSPNEDKLASNEKIDSLFSGNAKNAVHQAILLDSITMLTEREAVFTEDQLINALLTIGGVDHISLNDIAGLIKGALKAELIIPLKKGNATEHQKEQLFVSKEYFDYELHLVNALAESSEKTSIAKKPEKSHAITNDYLNDHLDLTKDQKAAMKTLFKELGRSIIPLEGAAKSGKSYLIKSLVQVGRLQGYQTIVLSPNKLGAQSLEKSCRFQPKNIRHFMKWLYDTSQYHSVAGLLHQYQKQSPYLQSQLTSKPKLIFIDQANLLNMKEMHQLISFAKETKATLVPLFDNKGLSSLGPGRVFEVIKSHKAPVIHLNSSKLENTSKDSSFPDSEVMLKRDASEYLDKMQSRLIEITDDQQRIEYISAHYSGLSAELRDNTLLIVPNAKEKEKLNASVHKDLISHGALGNEIVMATYQPKRLTSREKINASAYYQKDGVIRFNENYVSLGVEKGDYCYIKDFREKRNELILEKQDGQKVIWNPEKVGGRIDGAVECFVKQNMKLSVGEKLRWTRGVRLNQRDKGSQINSGENLIITGINKDTIVVRNQSGKTFRLERNTIEHAHFDYGYAVTYYQSLHQTPDIVISSINGKTRKTVQQQHHHVAAMANKVVWTYTNDKAALLENMAKSFPEQETLLVRLLSESKALNKEGNFISGAELASLSKAAIIELVSEYSESTQLAHLEGQKDPVKVAEMAIQYALNHLVEREAGFSHEALMAKAIGYALGDAKKEMLQEKIAEANEKGYLIKGLVSDDGKYWTTQRMLDTEKSIIKMANEGRGALNALMNEAYIKEQVPSLSLGQEQKEALVTLGMNKDRFVILQGLAGTGKTTLLKTYDELLHAYHALGESQGVQVKYLAPTHVAVAEIKARGLEAQTLDSFIGEYQREKPSVKRAPLNNTVLVVDEHSMISNERQLALMNIVVSEGAKCIQVGDTYQYQAIEAGKPTTLLSQLLTPIVLKDIQRQKTPELLEAVKATYAGNLHKALNLLNDRVIEMKRYDNEEGKSREATDFIERALERMEEGGGGMHDRDDPSSRLFAIRDQYMKLSLAERAKTMIIQLIHPERYEQNALIREALQKEGALSGKEVASHIYVQQDYTQAELKHSKNYAENQIVHFGISDKNTGIKKGEYVRIVKTEEKQNILLLEKQNGDIVHYKLPKPNDKSRVPFSVYEKSEQGLMKGDLIRWTRSQKELGILGSELQKVVNVEEGKVTLSAVMVNQDGLQVSEQKRIINLNDQRFWHWDYAFSMTAYGVQGKSISRVIANFPSYYKRATTARSFLVGLTRAIHDISIYTDDKGGLLKGLAEHNSDKTSALEITGALAHQLKDKAYSNENIPREKVIDNKRKTPTNDRQQDVKQGSLSLGKPSKSTLGTNQKNVFLDSNKIKEVLKENIEDIAIQLIDQPVKRVGNTLKFGSKNGSLVVNISGEKQGLWKDFQHSSLGGGPLELVAHYMGIDAKTEYQKLLKTAVALVHGNEKMFQKDGIIVHRKTTPSKQERDRSFSKNWTQQEQKTVKYAQKLAQESRPIKGTLAEQYLQMHRGIHLDKFNHLSDSVRFHPGVFSGLNGRKKIPALLLIAKTDKGEVRTVQATYLDPKTANKDKTLKVNKQTWGVIDGATVTIKSKEKADAMTYISEGVETGLSVLQAAEKGELKVTLGSSNFNKVDQYKTTNHVVFCFDNDAGKDYAKEHISTAKRLEDQGKKADYILPKNQGFDYNDVLLKQGETNIKNDLNKLASFHKNSQISANKSTRNEIRNTRSPNKIHTNYKEKIAKEAAKIDRNAHLKTAKLNKKTRSISKEIQR